MPTTRTISLIRMIMVMAIAAATIVVPAAAAPPVSVAPAGTDADPLRLDELVITATRSQREVFDTPLPVNRITRDDIDRLTPRSMADLFRRQPGPDVSVTGPGSVRPMIRGLYDDRVLILVDGIRLSEQRGGGNHAFSISPHQIERIEVIRGPASVLYGSDAIGGVINIITRPDHTVASKSGGAGKNGGGTATLACDGATDGRQEILTMYADDGTWQLRAAASHRDTGNLETADGELRHSFFDGGTVSVGARHHGPVWTADLSGYFSSADIGIPNRTATVSVFDGEQHLFTALSMQADNPWGRLENTVIDAAFQRHERHMHLRNPTGPDTDLEMDIIVDIDTWNLQPHTVISLGDRHRLTVGSQLFYEEVTSARDRRLLTRTAGTATPMPPSGVIPDATRLGAGFYAQDEIILTDRISTIAALRGDWIRSEANDEKGHPLGPETASDRSLSGSLGLLCALTDRINLTANIGRAFRAPTLLERFFHGPHQDTVDRGNPDLAPETSLNLDAGIRYRGTRFQGSAALFLNRIDDYIVKRRTGVFDADSGLEITRWENVTRAELYGGELEGELDLGAGFSLRTCISLVRGRDDHTGDDLPDIPPVKGTATLRWENDTAARNLWVETATHAAAGQDHPGPGESATPGYTTFDLRAGWDWKKRLEFIVSAENLGDKSFHDHLSRVSWMNEQPGRHLQAKITARF
ncbi:MAG: TonB-dependent receptor [Deltaproteobacteria bacterium]|nr:TonB-dependent receptor [Candidatus Anaeroferrophillacea bacterium]